VKEGNRVIFSSVGGLMPIMGLVAFGNTGHFRKRRRDTAPAMERTPSFYIKKFKTKQSV